MVLGQVEVVQDPHPGYLRQDLAREVIAAEVGEGEKAAPADLRHDPAGEVVPAEVELGELLQPADLRQDLVGEAVSTEEKLLDAGKLVDGWQQITGECSSLSTSRFGEVPREETSSSCSQLLRLSSARMPPAKVFSQSCTTSSSGSSPTKSGMVTNPLQCGHKFATTSRASRRKFLAVT